MGQIIYREYIVFRYSNISCSLARKARTRETTVQKCSDNFTVCWSIYFPCIDMHREFCGRLRCQVQMSESPVISIDCSKHSGICERGCTALRSFMSSTKNKRSFSFDKMCEGSKNQVTTQTAVTDHDYCINILLKKSVINYCYEFYTSLSVFSSMLCNFIALLILLFTVLKLSIPHKRLME